jgi:multisubunit Na+/H+ antiporter MnhF subunit
MNLWMTASLVLACGFVPCIWVGARSDMGSALAALSIASVIAATMLITLTVALARPPFIELGVVLAPLALLGSLTFVRFIERRR